MSATVQMPIAAVSETLRTLNSKAILQAKESTQAECIAHARIRAEYAFLGLLKLKGDIAKNAELVMCTFEYAASGAKFFTGWERSTWIRAFDVRFTELVEQRIAGGAS